MDGEIERFFFNEEHICNREVIENEKYRVYYIAERIERSIENYSEIS